MSNLIALVKNHEVQNPKPACGCAFILLLNELIIVNKMIFLAIVSFKVNKNEYFTFQRFKYRWFLGGCHFD